MIEGLPPGVQIPFGQPIKGMEFKFPKLLDPQSEAALKKCREDPNSRFMILIFRAGKPDANNDVTVNLHACYGRGWNVMWWMLAFQCFLSEMLKFDPAKLFKAPAAPQPEVVSSTAPAGDRVIRPSEPQPGPQAELPPEAAEPPLVPLPPDLPAAPEPPDLDVDADL